MGVSKKKKIKQEYDDLNNRKIISKQNRNEKSIKQTRDPDKYYELNPSWNFSNCDNEIWEFTEKSIGNLFWNEILPFLKELERKKWNEILIDSKKQNHSIEIENLSKKAINRLSELHIEVDSVISLRLTGTHRIYGYISKSVFQILWIDLKHGDNKSCVCRSSKKHT